MNNTKFSFFERKFIVIKEDNNNFYLHPATLPENNYFEDQVIEKECFENILNPLDEAEINIGFEFTCYTSKDGIEKAKTKIMDKMNERINYYENIISLRKNLLIKERFFSSR